MALLAVVLLAACQTERADIPPHLELQTITPQMLMRRLEEQQARVKSLRSFIRTTIRHEKNEQSFRQALLVSAGHVVRLDTLGPFGQTLGVFINGGGRTLLLDPAANKLLQGPQARDALFRILGAPFDLDDFAYLFYGHIPGLENHVLHLAELEPQKTFYRLITESSDKKERFEIRLNPVTLAPERWTRWRNDIREYTARWSDYRPVGGIPFSHQVSLEHPRFAEKILVQYSDPEINPDLPEEFFQIAPATGTP